MEADILHRNIRTHERIAALGLVRLDEMLCAPGHTTLRSPPAARALCDRLRNGGDLLDLEPIVLNALTKTCPSGSVELLAVQCIDGNHRVAASVLAGVGTVECLLQ